MALRNGCIEFDQGMVGKGVLTCYMALRNGCIEFDPGMVGKGVLTCYMALRNGCIEFDPGMVGKGVLKCHMTSLPKWSVEKLQSANTTGCWPATVVGQSVQGNYMARTQYFVDMESLTVEVADVEWSGLASYEAVETKRFQKSRMAGQASKSCSVYCACATAPVLFCYCPLMFQ